MRVEAERWLHYANEDMVTARVTLAGKRWAATSFHAQQAAEKALKALWLERQGQEPPRVHDLVRLAEEVGLPSEWFEEIDVLSRVYVVSRYPGAAAEDEPPYGISAEAATLHLALAERIIEWINGQLSTESSSD